MQQARTERSLGNNPSPGPANSDKSSGSFSIIDWGLRIFGLAFIDGIAIWFALTLYNDHNPIAAAILLILTLLINYIFLSNRFYPVRWLTPGLAMLILMVIYPLGYNIYISFTNYNLGQPSKDQAISQLKSQTYQPANALTYSFTAYKNPAGSDYKVILISSDKSKAFIADPTGLKSTDPNAAIPNTLDGFTKLTAFQAPQALPTLNSYPLKNGDIAITFLTGTQAKELLSKYSYDDASGKLTDLETNKVYTPVKGTFTAPDGTTLTPSFTETIGFENYTKVFTDGNITGPFFGVFIWTFLFAGFSVLLTFSVGIGMALVLNDEKLPFRTFFRVVLFIPYTIPAFISSLIWAGLFSIIGPVGTFSQSILGQNFSWFADANAAKVMILFVNTWLGYPYMMLICLGALQSIPADIYEAATIDGASRVQKFWALTLPLLLVSVGPLLIGSFAFNFNNFGLIQLMTQGGPDDPSTTTPAGKTDILISYTYRLAFASGKGGDLGLAATISLFIFIIIAAITIFSFRYTKQLEEVMN